MHADNAHWGFFAFAFVKGVQENKIVLSRENIEKGELEKYIIYM